MLKISDQRLARKTRGRSPETEKKARQRLAIVSIIRGNVGRIFANGISCIAANDVHEFSRLRLGQCGQSLRRARTGDFSFRTSRGCLAGSRSSARVRVQCLVHISGIGADPGSPSLYIRKRGERELAVRAAFVHAALTPSGTSAADQHLELCADAASPHDRQATSPLKAVLCFGNHTYPFNM